MNKFFSPLFITAFLSSRISTVKYFVKKGTVNYNHLVFKILKPVSSQTLMRVSYLTFIIKRKI